MRRWCRTREVLSSYLLWPATMRETVNGSRGGFRPLSLRRPQAPPALFTGGRQNSRRITLRLEASSRALDSRSGMSSERVGTTALGARFGLQLRQKRPPIIPGRFRDYGPPNGASQARGSGSGHGLGQAEPLREAAEGLFKGGGRRGDGVHCPCSAGNAGQRA